MTRRHHQRPFQPPPAPAAPAAADPHRARLARLGALAVAAWYCGGFVLLFAGALLGVGPYAWAAAWQVRHWGGDNVLLSFLPGFVALAAPLVLLQLLPRRPDWPVLCGAKDALFPSRDAPVPPPPTPERMARLLLRMARVALVLSVLSLVAGGVGCFLVLRIGDRDAGTPLPELTLAMTAAGDLPGYARLVGVVARPEYGWVHDHAVRQTRYHDVYTPLTGPGWQPGDTVTLLEKDSTVVGDSPAAPGPAEGALVQSSLPTWMVTELRRSGVAVVDDPVVLVRQDLNGVQPGADIVGVVMTLVFGTGFALFLLVAALAWLHRRRKLLRHVQTADGARGPPPFPIGRR